MFPMPELQLVIFDCDGVLVDSEVISNRVLAEQLSVHGLPTTLPEARRDYQGLLLSQILSSAEARLGGSLPEGWIEHYVEVRAEAFRRELRPVANAAQLIERIEAAGLAVCVASQGALTKTALSLELTGLSERFSAEARFSATQVERGKPFPDLFLHAAQSMGASPSACVVVEDTPSGVTAAVAAGMRVFAFAADGDPRALAEAGGDVVMSLAELPALLDIE
jgi:HAD superfamily hydrolase (TIGR01509 family)